MLIHPQTTIDEGHAPGWDDMLALSAPGRILLAEDDAEMRALLASMLRRDGYEVIEARSGHQLLRYISAFLRSGHVVDPPDLVISDVRMPGGSGLQVLAELRRAEWTTPVILITGFGDAELHDEAARLGAAEVLDKPFDLNALRAAVHRFVPMI